jgi:uncharacterized protein (DUF169 family)
LNGFERLRQALNLASNPIGVKLIYEYEKLQKISGLFKDAGGSKRYCEYVKMASNGEFLNIKKGDFSCNVAEMMLIFHFYALILDLERPSVIVNCYAGFQQK